MVHVRGLAIKTGLRHVFKISKTNGLIHGRCVKPPVKEVVNRLLGLWLKASQAICHFQFCGSKGQRKLDAVGCSRNHRASNRGSSSSFGNIRGVDYHQIVRQETNLKNRLWDVNKYEAARGLVKR